MDINGRKADGWTNEQAVGETNRKKHKNDVGAPKKYKKVEVTATAAVTAKKSPSFISHTLVHFSCFDIIIGISISDGVQELQAIKYKNI